MSIIEQIKAKIERLKLGWNEVGQKGVELVLNDLLSFLSTLESEKPMQEGLEEEITRTYHDGSVADTTEMDHVDYENIACHFYELGCRRTAEKYDEIEYNRQRAEESVCEDLEKEISDYIDKHFHIRNDETLENGNDPLDTYDFYDAARHFAQWGAEHIANPSKTSSGSSETPNDLEEAVEKQIDEALFKWSYDDEDGIEQYVRDAFIAGAKWAMGRGVKGEVKDFCFVREVNYASAKIEFDTIPELKEGEEVIVQIRKKNQ